VATALVIGGSVGGLFAAHLLRQVGFDVMVFERATGDLGDRGTGIGTRAELFAVMRRIGLVADPAGEVAVRGRIGLGRDGQIVHEAMLPAITSAWSRIWRPLREALPDDCYAGRAALARIELRPERVTASFADGSRHDGDLLIGADGLHSMVRAQLLPAVKPGYAGYVAWRGVVEARELGGNIHDLLFHHMVFGFPDGELMLSIPMPGPQRGAHSGERRCHFVWFRPVAEAALAALCTDADGRAHGLSIPPPLIRPELIAALRRDADELLAPQLAMAVKAAAQIILQPIFDLESPSIAFARVALMGDAAFVARPHVASGVMKAAIDAEALADACDACGGNLPAALERYDTARRRYGTWLVARGRHIGATFQERGGDAQARIETIMREYGSAGTVRDQPMIARV
jgi:2-polyprenyl-6-methoxyphenol hydroxylase-like FAD-dependent oxidoreductase